VTLGVISGDDVVSIDQVTGPLDRERELVMNERRCMRPRRAKSCSRG
jgi:hypothetical protein